MNRHWYVVAPAIFGGASAHAVYHVASWIWPHAGRLVWLSEAATIGVGMALSALVLACAVDAVSRTVTRMADPAPYRGTAFREPVIGETTVILPRYRDDLMALADAVQRPGGGR